MSELQYQTLQFIGCSLLHSCMAGPEQGDSQRTKMNRDSANKELVVYLMYSHVSQYVPDPFKYRLGLMLPIYFGTGVCWSCVEIVCPTGWIWGVVFQWVWRPADKDVSFTLGGGGPGSSQPFRQSLITLNPSIDLRVMWPVFLIFSPPPHNHFLSPGLKSV